MKKDSNTIDKNKCNAWCDLSLALIKMTKDLNENEVKYIKAMFSIAFGNLELEELKKQYK